MVEYIKEWQDKKGSLDGHTGNNVWKEAEKKKITLHPWQSMLGKYKSDIKDKWEEWMEKLRKSKDDAKRRADFKAKRGNKDSNNNTSNANSNNSNSHQSVFNNKHPQSSSASAMPPRGMKRAAPHAPAPIIPDVKVRAPAAPAASRPQRQAQAPPQRDPQPPAHMHVRPGVPASKTILGSVMLNDRDKMVSELQGEIKQRDMVIDQQIEEKRKLRKNAEEDKRAKDEIIRAKDEKLREFCAANDELARENTTLAQADGKKNERIAQLEAENANLRTALLLANGKELDKNEQSKFEENVNISLNFRCIILILSVSAFSHCQNHR